MTKKILVHIGPPKSGTSAIQLALQSRIEKLSSLGIYYPAHETGDNGISSGNLDSILELGSNQKWIVSKNKIESLLKQFQSSSYHTLLLSSEYFFYLVDDIADLIPQALFVAYLRCPLETFESSYNQSVKRHFRTVPIDYGKNLHTTTLKILDNKINIVGSNRFLLRAYIPASEKPSLVSDFFSILNFDYDETERNVTNTSYSFEALEFKRWLNAFELFHLDREVDKALQTYSTSLPKFSLLPDHLFERFQKQAYHSVREFSESHQVNNSKYLLNYIRSRAEAPRVSQEISETQFCDVCSYLSQKFPNTYSKLCEELELLRKQNKLQSKDSSNLRLMLQYRQKATSLLGILKVFFRKFD